jgi:hypothetical protein
MGIARSVVCLTRMTRDHLVMTGAMPNARTTTITITITGITITMDRVRGITTIIARA